MNTSQLADAKKMWQALFPKVPAPTDEQWALWLIRHHSSTVKEGLCALATKYQRLEGKMDDTYMLKFASAVMNRITSQRRAA